MSMSQMAFTAFEPTPYKSLMARAERLLVQWFPTKHNEILGGLHAFTVETLVLDALLASGCGGPSFHRYTRDQQAVRIDGVEDLMFELLSPDLIPFYAEKIAQPRRSLLDRM